MGFLLEQLTYATSSAADAFFASNFGAGGGLLLGGLALGLWMAGGG